MYQIQATLQNILMKIIFQYSAQHLTGQMIDLGAFHPLHTIALNKAGNLFLTDKFKDPWSSLLDDLSHLTVILRICQPAACCQAQVGTGQTTLHNLWRQEVFLHKATHRLGNTGLIAWNDLGVITQKSGNRQLAKRIAEQNGNCVPVCHSTYHTRFCRQHQDMDQPYIFWQ